MSAGQITVHENAQGGGIPLSDALIAIYASYYMGAQRNGVADHANAHIDLRAKNTFNMTGAMEDAFTNAESPWVVLDHLSDKRRDGGVNTTQPMHGAHFLTVYHRKTGQVMITMPGLETDDSPVGDALMDLQQMAFGGMRGQSLALYNYAEDIKRRMAAGEFIGPDGKPLPITNDKPVIGAHSLGCTAAQMMTLADYKTVLIEPRPVHAGLINRLVENFSLVTGEAKPERQTVLDSLNAGTVNIRSGVSNAWNSIMLPWVAQQDVGQNFVYGSAGHKISPLDRTIFTLHRVEHSVPSINGNTEAKGYAGDVTVRAAEAGEHRPLIADIRRNIAEQGNNRR